MAPFIDYKIIFDNSDSCYKYMVPDHKVIITSKKSLICWAHEEADTKIIYHICFVVPTRTR